MIHLLYMQQNTQANATPTALQFVTFGIFFLLGLWLTSKFLVSISDEGFFPKFMFGMIGIFISLTFSIMFGYALGASLWIPVFIVAMAGLASILVFFSKDKTQSKLP